MTKPKKRKKKASWSEVLPGLAASDQITKFKNIAVYDIADGIYEMYERYEVKMTPIGAQVIRFSDDLVIHFTNMKTAVTWATFDHRNMIHDCNRICAIDHKISSLRLEIDIQNKKSTKTNKLDDHLICLTKLQSASDKLKELSKEMTSYANSAHNWQISQFNSKA